VELDHAEFVERRVDDGVEAVEVRLRDLDLGDRAVAEEVENRPVGAGRRGVDGLEELDDVVARSDAWLPCGPC
jgi:hypothetical protein